MTNVFTQLFFITSSTKQSEQGPVILEDVSLLTFPEVTDYLDSITIEVQDSVVKKVLDTLKA